MRYSLLLRPGGLPGRPFGSWPILCQIVFFALLSGLASGRGRAAVSVFVNEPDGMHGFELYGNAIYWWEGGGACGGEFPQTASIHFKNSVLPNYSLNTLAKSCGILGNNGYPVRDNTYFYFFANGVLHRKALGTPQLTPSQPVPTPVGIPTPTLAPGRTGAALALRDGRLYWARYTPSSGITDFYSMPVDGSEGPKYLVPIVANSDVVSLQHFYNLEGGVNISCLAILFENGKLYRYKRNANGTLNLIASSITDCHVREEPLLSGEHSTTLYATQGLLGAVTKGATPSKLLQISATTGAVSVLYTAQSDNQLMSVTTDGDDFSDTSNIYLAEGIVTCGALFCNIQDYAIRRRPVNLPTVPWSTILLNGGGVNLRSNQKDLYFLRTNTVKTLPVNTPDIQFAIKADAVEVVQSVQNLLSSVTLVANRPTYVRAYAHLTKNNTGQTQWFPDSRLRGFRNGVELPGSPIAPINSAYIDTTNTLSVLRADVQRSFLFQLPPSWTAASGQAVDNLDFEFTVNPELSVPETEVDALANNIVRLKSPARMVRKGWPCVITVPFINKGPRYVPSEDPKLGDIIERARNLLPVEDISVFTFAITEPQGDEDEPFDMISGSKEERSDMADELLDAVDDVDAESDPCDDKDDVHYVGMLHEGAITTPGTIGSGEVNGVDSWVTAFHGNSSGVAPGGGLDIAHEFGHNYGRAHIDCGVFTEDQADFDDVPYPKSLGNPNENALDATFGFDTMLLAVRRPTQNCDILSYGATRWISEPTWQALLDETAEPVSAASRRAFPAGGSAPEVLLVRGRVNVTQQLAYFRDCQHLPAGAAPATKVLRSLGDSRKASTEPNPYQIRLLDSEGRSLSLTPLFLHELSTHEGGDEVLPFTQHIPFAPGARGLQLVHAGRVLAERIFSAHAPTLTLGQVYLQPDTQRLTLDWKASDADGDPLRFSVHFSSDNGVRWQLLKRNYKVLSVNLDATSLPGGTQCRVRVVASDGLNTTLAMTPPFALAKHAPISRIGGLRAGELLDFGTLRALRSVSSDAETPSRYLQLNWSLTGPQSATGQGTTFDLSELRPGSYSMQLVATDPDKQKGTSTVPFRVGPLFVKDGVQPHFDGLGHSHVYADSSRVRLPLGNGAFATARLLHANGRLYVAFNGLRYTSGRGGLRSAGIRIDTTHRGRLNAGAGDVGFFVDEDGLPHQEIANAAGVMVRDVSPALGFTAQIHRGPQSWDAELCIDDALLGGWNHLVGLMLAHDALHWPADATNDHPSSWAPAVLGSAPGATENLPPVANAGPDYQLAPSKSTTLHLDGTASHDPEGSALLYVWKQVDGPAATIHDAGSVHPQIDVNPVLVDTLLTFQLVVSDGVTSSSADFMRILIRPPEQRLPIVDPQVFAQTYPSGHLALRLAGLARKTHRLQMSGDLNTWQDIKILQADDIGRVDFTGQIPNPGGANTFFRVVIQ